MVKGNILIRNDSSTLISSDIYKKYISGFDSRVLSSLDGGGIHACGLVDKHIDDFLNVDKMNSFDFGQAEQNPIEQIYTKALKLRIPLLRVKVDIQEISNGNVMKTFPTGVSLFIQVKSLREAKQIMTEYILATEG
jgi:hypothetical protein